MGVMQRKVQYRGIESRLLYPQDALVIAMMTSKKEHSADYYIFQVVNYAELILRDKLRDKSGSVVTLNAGSGRDYDYIYDSDGKDVLRIRARDELMWYMYHFSIAVLQDKIRIYPRIPPSQTGGAFEYLTIERPKPIDGDPFGYILSDETDYYNPPVSLEAVTWMSGEQSIIQYGFYNEGTSNVQPDISIRGRAYIVAPYTKSDDEKRAVINAILKEDIRGIIVQFGPIKDTFSVNIPKAWNDCKLHVSTAELPVEARHL